MRIVLKYVDSSCLLIPEDDFMLSGAEGNELPIVMYVVYRRCRVDKQSVLAR